MSINMKNTDSILQKKKCQGRREMKGGSKKSGSNIGAKVRSLEGREIVQ